MKYLLVLAVVLVAFFVWRNNRRDRVRAEPPRTPSSGRTPQNMTRCAHCDMHLPETDALKGRNGHYCSLQHRILAEG